MQLEASFLILICALIFCIQTLDSGVIAWQDANRQRTRGERVTATQFVAGLAGFVLAERGPAAQALNGAGFIAGIVL
jgi:hypothetical protein